jgi:hypothetical protein
MSFPISTRQFLCITLSLTHSLTSSALNSRYLSLNHVVVDQAVLPAASAAGAGGGGCVAALGGGRERESPRRVAVAARAGSRAPMWTCRAFLHWRTSAAGMSHSHSLTHSLTYILTHEYTQSLPSTDSLYNLIHMRNRLRTHPLIVVCL